MNCIQINIVNPRDNMFRYVIIAFVAFSAGSDALKNRIINGRDDSIEHRPYLVAIEYKNVHKCGGSIISKSYVLTAGHCLHWTYQIPQIAIRTGSNFKERGGEVTYAEKFLRPLDYRSYNHNDIAVIKVKDPFNYGPTRQPIELFAKGEKVEPGTKAVVSGWGKTLKTNWDHKLQSVVLPILANSTCQQAYNTTKLSPGQLCAGYYGKGGKDSCQGDSGGPLVIKGRQVGVVSWGTGCAEARYPGIYTEVAYFRDWIDSNVVYDD